MQRIPFDLQRYRSEMLSILGTSQDYDVFWRAVDYAFEAHSDQWRKSGDAYILHPCSVAKILAKEMDIDHPEILTSALLHDTIEDVEEVTPEVVGELFGSYVQAIVEGCTKVTHVSGDKQMISKRTHRKIFSGAALRPEVMLVKLADRLHNLRTLDAMPKHKQQRIADETLDIYAPLATVFGLFEMKREMYNLALVYKFPRQSGKLKNYLRKLSSEEILQDIVTKLETGSAKEGLNCVVSTRTKDLWAYFDISSRVLLKRIDTPIEILILVDESKFCYQLLGLINCIFPPIPRTIRDFIANPKPTGYQGLHARAIIEGRKYIVKIRTNNMARRAQRGMFRNWTSKSDNQGTFVKDIQEMFDVIGSEDSISYREVIAARGKKEIYTYTPQGDLICLPVDSTVLDFSFRVHTQIGSSCVGAKLRGKRVGVDHVLRDGDMLKVVRSNEMVRFEQESIDRCRTPRARSEVAKSFRARHRRVTIKIGASMFRQEMRRYGLDYDDFLSFDLGNFLKRFALETIDALHAQIGEGRLHLQGIIAILKEELFDGVSPFVVPTGAFNSIRLTTLDPVSVKLSSCCHPNPTAKDNFALLRENVVSVHHKKCKRLQQIPFRRDDAVNITWAHSKTTVRRVQMVKIFKAEQCEVMTFLGMVPECMKVQRVETALEERHRNSAEHTWEIFFKVENLSELLKVQRYMDKSSVEYSWVFTA
ncbi:MAG: HD domain-containing protein [Desulfotalea sp.]